jgi:hypothetical protein
MLKRRILFVLFIFLLGLTIFSNGPTNFERKTLITCLKRVNTVDSIACPQPHGVSTHLFHENSAVEGDGDKRCYRL